MSDQGWNQTRAAGVPGNQVSATRDSGDLSATGAGEGLSHQGRTSMYTKIQLPGRTGVRKACEGLSASSWSGDCGSEAHVAGASCWGGDRQVFSSSVNLLCTCKIQQQT